MESNLQTHESSRAGMPALPAVPLVSLVILTYKSAKYMRMCLETVAKLDYKPLEILVPDSLSQDDTLQATEDAAKAIGLDVKILPLPWNRGWSAGNNAGWRESHGEFVVFLNPDTEVTPNFITELVKPMIDDPTVGITGSKMYYPNTKRMQHAGAMIRPNGMTWHFGWEEEDTGQYDELREVHYVTGAGIGVRRAVLEKLNGFDEDYFPAYYEEVDFATRTRKHGWRILFVPTAVMYHHESYCYKVNSPSFRTQYERMRIRYLLKNYGLREWLTQIIPAEIKWYRPKYNAGAKGFWHDQIQAYFAAIPWLIQRKILRRPPWPKP